MPELIVHKNSKVFFRVPLSQKNFRIGRSPNNDLTLPDEEISRHHAEIFYQEGIHYLKDTSTGGTRIDNNPAQLSRLKDESRIDIGPWNLIFKSNGKFENEWKDEVQTRVTQIRSESPTRILKLDPNNDRLMTQTPYLLVTEQGKSSRSITISQEIATIGSDPNCDLSIQDDYVSHHHCRLEKTNTGYRLVDLNSTNGILVQGTRVESITLSQKTEFTIGQTKLVFDYDLNEEEIKPAIDESFCGLLGKSEIMRRLFAKIERVAPTEHSVLVYGETGSGKELVARAIHELSARNKKPYVILNCGAISPNLIESELFGHEKGAFTGAINRHFGAFEQAENGTLFLDEIGEIPLELQSKLLRVLENQTIRRVGGHEEISVNIRIIAATHQNLAEQVKKNKFREDLYFRLHVIPLTVPPLRSRGEDIELLASHFIKQAMEEKTKTLSAEALVKLAKHTWPGNVRELKNAIFRSLIFCDEPVIQPKNIEIFEKLTKESNKINLTSLEKDKIQEALSKTKGNRTKAADLLGIAKSTLFKKLREFNMGE